jgi:polyisoprenoid-binding protein YceI
MLPSSRVSTQNRGGTLRRFSRRSRSIALAALVFLACGHATATEYTIDPERTDVSFEMRSLGSVQRGRFHGAEGTVALDAGTAGGRVDIVIDARSVEAGNQGIETLLRGPGLLDVHAHPQIGYSARRVIFADGGPARIEGDLTLRGVTRAVPLDVARYDCTSPNLQTQRCSIVASATFSRSAFGMTSYRLFASDEVILAIHAEGVRTP